MKRLAGLIVAVGMLAGLGGCVYEPYRQPSVTYDDGTAAGGYAEGYDGYGYGGPYAYAPAYYGGYYGPWCCYSPFIGFGFSYYGGYRGYRGWHGAPAAHWHH